MTSIRQDLRFALRTLGGRPGFTAATTVVLACGIGLAVPLLSLIGRGLAYPGSTANPPELVGIESSGGVGGWTSRMIPPARAQGENLDALLTALLALTLFVLAISCINVLILLLSRATARNREMAVRATLGASPLRVTRQLLAEGSVLTLGAAALGFASAFGGIALLRATWPEGLPLWLGGPELRATLVGAGLPVGLALLVMMAPGLVARRRNPGSVLGSGGRATSSRGEGVLQRVLLVVAVTATTLLLTGAGLLLQATAPLGPTSGGSHGWGGSVGGGERGEPDGAGAPLDPAAVLSLLVQAPPSDGPDAVADRVAFYETLLAQVRDVEGVRAASVATPGTLMGLGVRDHDVVDCGRCSVGGLSLPVFATFARHHVIGPDYFDTLGITVESGREFSEADRPGSSPVAVVNDAYRASFERGDPIGRGVKVGGFGGEWHTVVGVVRDAPVPGIGAGSPAEPAIYLAGLQHPPRSVVLTVKVDEGSGRSAEIASRVRAELSGMPMGEGAITLPPSAPSHLADRLDRFLAPLRWFSRIFVVLASAALVLATAALYGVLSHSVRLRRREIGVRIALGASPRRVVRDVVADGVRMTLVGALIGFAGTVGVVGLLREAFHGVKLFDAGVHSAVVVLLLLVGVLASWIPARRAAAVDPNVAMRGE